jgi:multidrug efflux pump subunit AcrA (membrane-fusion protein)
VWIELANPDRLLKPNMFATASLVLNRNDSALAIPNDAILEANGEKFVFVKQGDAFDRVDIMIGASDDEYSEVTDGLVPGDEIVVQGKRQVYTMWLTGGQAKPD